MNYLDGISSAFLILAAEKLGYQGYVLATVGTSGLHYTSVLWGLLLLIQRSYLQTAYINQVFLIEKIEICSDLEHVRVHTVLSKMSYNIIAYARTVLGWGNKPQPTYVFPISECSFSDKDDPTSRVLRLEMSGTKFYCHRNRVVHQD